MNWLSVLEGRPKPVLTSAGVASAVTLVVGAAVTLGVLPAVDKAPVITAANTITGSAFTIVAALAPLLAALHAGTKVTPTAAPQDGQGRPLQPAAVATDSAVLSVPTQFAPVSTHDPETGLPASMSAGVLYGDLPGEVVAPDHLELDDLAADVPVGGDLLEPDDPGLKGDDLDFGALTSATAGANGSS